MALLEGTDIVEVELEETGQKVRVRRGETARVAAGSPAPVIAAVNSVFHILFFLTASLVLFQRVPFLNSPWLVLAPLGYFVQKAS